MTVRRRHVPLRTCVVCGNKTDKRELARIVATAEGQAHVGATGRERGRGAYVCRTQGCAVDRLRRARVEHALRTRLSDEAWNGMVAELGRALVAPRDNRPSAAADAAGQPERLDGEL